MAEHSPPIPDDLATCQAQLRAVLEQHAALLQRFHDLERQLDETCTTTEELRHIYPKYACSCCKDGVTSAPTASGPIVGGLAAPGLLAYVIVSKFVEHMPLYRQQDELARAHVLISRSTLSGWLEQCAQLFKPFVELLHKEVLQSDVIQGDETPVPVLDRSRDSTRKGYIW